MKRRMLTIFLLILLGAALVLGGKLLNRVLVTDRIADKGGMENPWAIEEPEGQRPSGEETKNDTDKES